MRKNLILGILALALVAMPFLTACDTTPTPTATATPSSATPTPTVAANWWDKFGTPSYGGELIIRTDQIGSMAVDPTNPKGGGYMIWYETLFTDSEWTVDRETQPFKGEFIPVEYYTGLLAESWEWTDATTVTVKMKEGIHFQDKEPVNGREVTAEDIVYCYDRIMGTGSGFTEPNAFYAGNLVDMEKVVAKETYTVEFQLKKSGALGIYMVLNGEQYSMVYPRELVDNDLMQDWGSANGTGPFILSDVSPEVSATYSRNPNYQGVDERHPENQIPYVDSMKFLTIPDATTALAALRTGRIDVFANPAATSGLTWQQALTLADSDPDIQQAWVPTGGQCLELRCDKEPFTDIKVRQALQMALDLPAIAQVLYGGTVDGTPSGLISSENIGWATPYEEWSDELKAEYAYDVPGAKALLADAGYPEGFETNCITFPGGEIALLETIKAQFSDIGVDLELKTMEFNAWIGMLYSGQHDQMTLMNTIGAVGSPTTALLRRASQTKANFTYCNDAYYDSLVSQVQSADTMEEAKSLAIEANQYALQQHWSINIFPYNTASAWQPYVKGYSGETIQRTAFYAARMWIDEDLK